MMKIAMLLFLISVVLLLSAASAAEMEKGAVKITEENATALAINYAKVNLKASNNVTVVDIKLESNLKMYRVTLTDNINEYILNVDSTTGAVSTVTVRPVETKEVKPESTEEKKKEVKEEKAEEKKKEVKEGEAEEKKKEELREEEEREKKNMRFARSGDTFDGKFVSFQISDGYILNYTFGGKTIFKSISLGFTPRIKAEGSEVELTAGEKEEKTEVKIHDNPNGLMTIETEDKVNITFTLATGIGAEVNQSKVELMGVNASIRRVGEEGTVNFTLSGSTLKASLDHGKIMFKAVPLTAKTEKEEEFDDEVSEGIAHKKIGAVVSIEKSESHDEVSFDDVKVVVNTVKNNTVSVNVSSSLTEGKTVVLRINNDILAAVSPRDVKVQFDGVEIQQADNYADVIDIKSDKPKYLIVIGAKDVEALVSIPKFSEHQITFTTTPKAPGFTALLGALALVFAVRYLVRRK